MPIVKAMHIPGEEALRAKVKQAIWIALVAGAMSAAAFAADREVKVDDRLDALAEGQASRSKEQRFGLMGKPTGNSAATIRPIVKFSQRTL
jgi:hypothetical protein